MQQPEIELRAKMTLEIPARDAKEVLYQNVVKKFHPEEISSMILTKMKTTAEACL